MRIISGTAKNRRLKSPQGLEARPTTDFIREALFNILPSVEGTVFCDIFAGSGAVGIEAISRGAKRVVFIEKSEAMSRLIADNLALCGFIDCFEIITKDATAAVKNIAARKDEFDFIFADPPYATGARDAVLLLFAKSTLLAGDGCLIVQHAANDIAEQKDSVVAGELLLAQCREYGNGALSFYKIS